MTQHTPGPWHWEIEDKSTATLSGKDSLEQHVMSVSPCKSCIDRLADDASPFGVCTMPTDANANLLATAPELLANVESLWHALDFLMSIVGTTEIPPKHPILWQSCWEVAKDAQTIVAKAKGET